MPLDSTLSVDIRRAYENQRFQGQGMFGVSTFIQRLSQMIGNVMLHSCSTTNICMRLDLQVTTKHFEILRRCGPMKRRDRWENHSANISETERQNGCGPVLSAQRNMQEIDVGKGGIVVDNVASLWSM
jgi:hypothetical protein